MVRGIPNGSGFTMEMNSRDRLTQWPAQIETMFIRITLRRIIHEEHTLIYFKKENGSSQKACWKGAPNKMQKII